MKQTPEEFTKKCNKLTTKAKLPIKVHLKRGYDNAGYFVEDRSIILGFPYTLQHKLSLNTTLFRRLAKERGINKLIPKELAVFLHELGHGIHQLRYPVEFKEFETNYFANRFCLQEREYEKLPLEVAANLEGVRFLVENKELINNCFNTRL